MIRAIKVEESDNVATLLFEAKAGDSVYVFNKAGEQAAVLTAANDIPRGHKIALKGISEGEPVMKYSFVIGTAMKDIAAGEHVHVHNESSNRGRGDLA